MRPFLFVKCSASCDDSQDFDLVVPVDDTTFVIRSQQLLPIDPNCCPPITHGLDELCHGCALFQFDFFVVAIDNHFQPPEILEYALSSSPSLSRS